MILFPVQGVAPYWAQTQSKAMQTYVLLLEVQEDFKKALIENVALFQLDCDQFCSDYQTKGPMEEGLSPREASDRLEAFQSQFDTLWRKHNSYRYNNTISGIIILYPTTPTAWARTCSACPTLTSPRWRGLRRS